MTAAALAKTPPAVGASSEFPHVLSGVVLDDARGINDSGWIVANGTNAQGQRRAFVLVPT